jgi:hypothetical protein
MNKKNVKKTSILGILFFLPVVFLLFLYPSTHNYNTLSIVNENVLDISTLVSESDHKDQLKDHLTVLGFLGTNPMDHTIMALNLKELIYDKFKGFKGFQVLLLVSEGSREQIAALEKELYQYDELKYWHFVYADNYEIENIFNSLSSKQNLDHNYATNEVFIIDRELNQRGRLDDRTDGEKERNAPIYGLESYNCIEIAVIKNKMGDDMRILFTEYRQKRKGNFDSSSRRAEDIKTDEKN